MPLLARPAEFLDKRCVANTEVHRAHHDNQDKAHDVPQQDGNNRQRHNGQITEDEYRHPSWLHRGNGNQVVHGAVWNAHS